MPKTPYPQGPPRVEASGSGRTNLQIDHEEMTDAAKQRRPELMRPSSWSAAPCLPTHRGNVEMHR
jgi:hypothetical protein